MRKYTALCLLPLFACALNAQTFFSGQAARAVIGQDTFSAGYAGTQAYLVGGANGVAYGNGYIWVADSNKLGFTPSNNRVLLFGAGEIPGARADISSFPVLDNDCHVCGFSAFNVLGQADFVSSNPGRGTTATPGANGAGYMQTPSGVATDGTVLAVADTDNNRVLIWNSLPLSSMTIPPDVVVGQSNFTNGTATLTQTGLSGPVGVWIQNGKLFVADTSNSRVLIWNSIPTANGQPADLVLGEPNFGTRPSTVPSAAAANQLYFPTSVTSDGTHLFVSDEGNSRILIWNTIPTSNDQPADVVVGQPDMVSSAADNTAVCGGASLCAASINFPQFALSDGTRLYVSDTGDNRVLVFNTIPTSNGANADVVLGQPNFTEDVNTSQTIEITSTVVDNTGAVDTIPSPGALAWDGTNLYVADPSNRRILLFTPADTPLPDYSVVNAASGPNSIRQEGVVAMTLTAGGTITANDTVTVTIQSTDYTYTEKANDTLDTIAQGLVSAINSSNSGAGDPNATAIFAGTGTGSVYLSSKALNPGYDTITLAVSGSNTANVNPIASGGYLTSGNSGTGSAGMLVQINGTNFTDPAGTTQVYMDGILVPIVSATDTQIIAQVPYTFTNGTAPSTDTTNVSGSDRNSVSVYVRTSHGANEPATITNATPLYIAPANPGLYSAGTTGQPPYPALNATHQAGNPNVIIDVDGTIHAGDVATLTVNGTNYTYTVLSTDDLQNVQDALIEAVNNAGDPNVTAAPGAAFNRIVLTARQSGAAGTGIPVSVSVSSSAQLTLTAYNSATCCNVTPGSVITPANPAAPGELITVNATGLGVVSFTSTNGSAATGQPYGGVIGDSTATNTVTATMGGSDAEVVSAGLAPGTYGTYQVEMIVPTSLTPNQYTQLYIAQNAFISNIVTIPVGSAVQAAPAGSAITSTPVIVSPVNVVFANQNLGSATTTRLVTVYNPSPTATLAITGYNIVGANAASFTTTDSTCVPTLPPGASCTISVTYNTGGTGVNSASLAVYDSSPGSPHMVSLSGFNVTNFSIISRYSGKALDVTGVSTDDGAVIQQWSYLSAGNQQWSFVPVGGGYFNIVNTNSGLVLDVTGLSTQDGALIQQWSSTGADNQKWTLIPTGDGYFKIQNLLSGKVLDVTGISTLDGVQIQQWDSYADPGNQQWQINPVQYYEIVNVNSGKVLDVTGVSLLDGAYIQQWDYLGGANQQWELTPVSGSGSYFTIQNHNSGKVLEVQGQSTQNGGTIDQYDSLGETNQQWAFLPTTVNGVYAIANNNSGRVLDVTALSTDDGALLQQYDYLAGANQQWTLIPLFVH